MALFTKKSEAKIELEQFPRAHAVSAPPIPTAPARRSYGIADAILLMRSLPVDQNVDLIVQVIRATLASMNVRVHDIIEDARRKEQATEAGIQSLHGKVAELERELEARRQEIIGLEEDLKETNGVKERLQLAENIAAVVPAHPLDAEPVAVSNGQFSYPHQT
jgi:hypothetical protein